MAGHNKGYARYTVSNTAVKLTDAPAAGTAMPAGSVTSVVIQNQSATDDVRWRDDGTAPTATEGMLLPAGATLFYDDDPNLFQMIRRTADVTVTVSYRCI